MSNNIKNLIKKADKLRSQNKLIESLKIYKSICNHEPHNMNAWLMYGSIAATVKKYDIAESAFRKACDFTSGFGKPNELLIQVLEIKGEIKKAIKILTLLENSNNHPNDIQLRLGVLYGKNGDFDNAVHSLEKYIVKNKNIAFAHHCLASAYDSKGNFEKAKTHFKIAISINNKDHILVNNYAATLHKAGKYDEAVSTYRESISINSEYPISLYNLAELQFSHGDYDEALELYTKAIALKADYVEALIGQGRCYHARGAKFAALKVFEKAVTIDSTFQSAHTCKASVEVTLGEFDKALYSLKIALKLEPNNIEIQCAIAEIYEKRGQFDKAENIIRPLLVSNSTHKNVVLIYSSLCKKLGECDVALDLINKSVSNIQYTKIDKASLHYKAGKILDASEKYDEAFSHYKLANNYQSFDYNADKIVQSYKNITTLFSYESVRSLPKSSIKNTSPIFIVGMPRSGTTLVEQIIASHPDIYGAGELIYLNILSRSVAGDFISGIDIKNTFNDISENYLNTLSEDYFSNIEKNIKNEKYFTDKMPHNFAFIGLINILFPESKIIHCKRNPIDNCLSIYFSEFNSMNSYATDLKNLAEYYTNYYEKLMDHWDTVNTLPIHHLMYEDIINNQENTSRQLIDFCGVEWDDKCLDFHNSNRDVTTISYDQVRQPIYTKSMARWKNYQSHISPLLEHFKNRM